ncbi:Predicted arabinose efflux permease, MFS family [Marinobacter antarcticus]|uniref:Predicted arabinose efflux permease, MFS family n=1 Tax=Marinobacter antarcticus TaxID=564117 RepID=A0A1M6VF88_9GAMM|nr:MFS transporter [Marinobacter antarcticus]SHK80140.1 Predicted arabinose efflux permease, MFS family [Marinobacter antarcticus]
MLRNTWQRYPLFVIVLAQLCGTSLWFSINGVWLSISRELGLSESDLGQLTLTVQAGFIVGTLGIAITGLADRFRASYIFAFSSVLGALMNAGFVITAALPPFDLVMRFLTGLCLAGIYPLGMKMVIGWTPKHTGTALAWLVGMLTLGTAMPHLLRGATLGLPWQWPLLGSSALALLGGMMVLLLGDGPHLPISTAKTRLRTGLAGLKSPRFRAVAGGYFGHCWELYAFWTLTPLLITREVLRMQAAPALIPLLSFTVIGVGFLGCVGGGRLSQRFGSQWVANRALAISGMICLAYPFLPWAPPGALLMLLMLWGITVIADSPQFSALAASAAPREFVGASLAVMNAIGFALTIPAIWITSNLWESQGTWVTLWLLPGPVLGLWSMRRLNTQECQSRPRC